MKCSYYSTLRFTNFVTSKLCGKGIIPALSIVNKQCFSTVPNSVPEKDETLKKDTVPERQVVFLKTKLTENSSFDWKALEEETLSINGYLTKRNIGGKILDICSSVKNLDAGKSFLNHLKSSNTSLSLAVYLMYFKLCYGCKDQLTKNDREELLEMYETVISKHKLLLYGRIAESVVMGVTLTDKWKDGLKYLEISKEAGMPNGTTYNALIEAAASRCEFDIALKLLDEYYAFDRGVCSSVLTSFVNECVQHNQLPHIESLFHLISRHLLTPDKNFAENLVDLCSKKQIPFKGNKTSITLNGRCMECSQSLAPIKISKEQYNELRSAFVSQSFIGPNIFIKTNPSELKAFLNFIDKTSPYDVVIDGLNTAHIQNTPKHPKSLMLKKVAEQFVKQNKKILILGRKHMQHFRDSNMQYLFKHCNFFFVDNLSSDDHFLLYAALYGDQGTEFVSNDFMRGHKYLLGTTELKRTFKLWQQAHQICPRFVSESYVKLKFPVKHQLFPHVLNDGTWHIPYCSSDGTVFSSSYSYYEDHLSWLCLSPSKNKSTKP